MELISAGTPELPRESPMRPCYWPMSSSLPTPGLMSPPSPSYPGQHHHPYAPTSYQAPSPAPAPYQHLSQRHRAKAEHGHLQSSRDPRAVPMFASPPMPVPMRSAPAVRRMSAV